METALHNCYANVDFSLLPIQIEKLWLGATNVGNGSNEHSHYISELARFSGVMIMYRAFVNALGPTRVLSVSRTVKIRDHYDLCAYMARNGGQVIIDKLDDTDISISSALDYIDKQVKRGADVDQVPTEVANEKLLCEYKKQAERMLDEQIVIHRYLWEKDREKLGLVRGFVFLHQRELNDEHPFINQEHDYEPMKAATLFHRLSITDQLELADGSWRTIDLERRPTIYLLVIKLLFDCTMERSQHTRHPYLIARWGNPFEIAQYILKEAKGSEQTMRILVNNYALVANIDTPELTSRCLSLQNRLRQEGFTL